MRNNIIKILTIIVLIFLSYSVYSFQKTKNESFSGSYKNLYFENLRKDGNSYYIKFSRQEEKKPLPEICKSLDELTEEQDFYCMLESKETQSKIPSDIDISKEYRFVNDSSIVELYSYSGEIKNVPISVEVFYDYIQEEKPSTEEDYGGVLENPQNWGFDVTIKNGKVTNIKQIYQE